MAAARRGQFSGVSEPPGWESTGTPEVEDALMPALGLHPELSDRPLVTQKDGFLMRPAHLPCGCRNQDSEMRRMCC